MSKLVDERVVELTFDNKKFESNMKESMSTLDRLKSALNFSGVANSINKSMQAITLSPLEEAMESAKESFGSFADYVKLTVVQRMTNKVLDAAERMAKALSIDQVTSGWEKFNNITKNSGTLVTAYTDMYGTQEAAQSIVERSLDKLRWYSDSTSYSIETMSQALSSFANNGVDLDVATNSIMGIAQWAGQAGVDVTKASGAMELLAKSVSKGSVDLQKWNSLSLYGMTTDKFKSQVVQSAIDMGELTQDALGDVYVKGTKDLVAKFNQETGKLEYTGITETLSKGWLNNEVLIKTLDKYSSALGDIYELQNTAGNGIDTVSQAIEAQNKALEEGVLGLSEEDKEFQKMSIAAFEAASECRTLTDAVNAAKDAVSSGWANIYTSIFGDYSQAKGVWTRFYDDFLGPVFVDGIGSFSRIFKQWNELGGRDDLFGEGGAFWNLINVFTTFKDIAKEAFQAVFPIFKEFNGQSLKDFTQKLKESSENWALVGDRADSVFNILKGVFSIFKLIGGAISTIWKIAQPILNLAKSIVGYFVAMLGDLGIWVTSFVDHFGGLSTMVDSIASKLSKLIETIKQLEFVQYIINLFDKFREKLRNGFSLTDNAISIFEGLKGLGTILKSVFESISYVLTNTLVPAMKWLVDAIGPRFINFIVNVSKKISEFASSLKTNDTIKKRAEGFVDWLKGFVPFFKSAANFLINIFAAIGNGIVAFAKVLTSGTVKGVKNVFGAIASGITTAVDKIGLAIATFGKLKPEPIEDFAEELSDKLSPLESLFVGLKEFASGIIAIVSSVMPFIGRVLSKIGNMFKQLADLINKTFTDNNGNFNLKKVLGIGTVVLVLIKILSFSRGFIGIAKGITNLERSFDRYLGAKRIQALASAFKDFAKGMILLVVAISILTSIDTDRLMDTMRVLGQVGLVLGLIALAIAGVLMATKKTTVVVTQVNNASRTLGSSLADMGRELSSSLAMSAKIASIGSAILGIAAAVVLIAAAMKMLSKMDQKEINQSLKTLGIIGASLAAMILVLAIAAKISAKGKVMKFKHIFSIAVGMASLIPVMNNLGKMDTTSLVKSVAAVSVLGMVFSAMFVASKRAFNTEADKGTFMKSIATGLQMMWAFSSLANAVNKVVDAAVRLSAVNNAVTTVIAVESMVAIMTGLSFMLSKISGNGSAKLFFGFGVTMNLIALAFLEIAEAVKIMNELSPQQIISALGGMSLIMLSVFAFFAKDTKTNKTASTLTKERVKNFATLAASLSMLGGSMLIIASAMAVFKGIDIATIGRASLAFVSFLAAVSLFMLATKKITKDSDELIKMASVMAIMSTAMVGIAFAMNIMAGLSIADIGKGLLVIVSALGAFAITMLALSVLAPQVIMVSGAIALFSAGILMLALSVRIIIESMILFSMYFPVFTDTLIDNAEGLKQSIRIIGEAFLGLAGTLGEVFLQAIMTMASKIGPTILTALDSIYNNITEIAGKALSIIFKVLDSIADNVGALVDSLVTIILNMVRALTNRVKEIIDVFGEFVITFIIGGFKKLSEIIPRIVEAMIQFIIDVLNGLADVLDRKSGELREAIIKFRDSFFNAIKTVLFGAEFKPAEWLKGVWDKLKAAGKNLIDGIVEGVGSAWNEIVDTITDIGGAIKDKFCKIFKIHSPSRVFAEYGGYMMEGLAIGMEDTLGAVDKSLDTVGNNVTDNMSSILSDVADIINADVSDDIVITPVLDLSQIQNGANQIDGMMNGLNGYSISGSNSYASNAYESVASRNRSTVQSSEQAVQATQTVSPTSITNTFNITGDNSEDIANKVAETLQKQINRGKAAWAL